MGEISIKNNQYEKWGKTKRRPRKNVSPKEQKNYV
jgi:hypothetical protein